MSVSVEPKVPRLHADLRELLGAYLDHTPTASATDAILADFMRLHPGLLVGSLKEAIAGPPGPHRTDREHLHRIYHRKTKEMAAMYPLLLSLEGAFRARLTAEFFRHFGVDDWWMPIYAAIRKGGDSTSVKEINGIRVTSHLARRLGDVIMMIEGERFQHPKVATLTCGSEFFAQTTFGQLRYIVGTSWSEFGHVFRGRRGAVKAITKDEFMELTKVVLDARNDLYHHNPISSRQACVTASETLADHLDCHIGSTDAEIGRTSYPRPEFKIAPQQRHHALNGCWTDAATQ